MFAVGGQLSCFHLVTSELDYREDATVDVVQVDVPGSLVAPIEELVRRKGFDYCALDFRCRNGFEDPVFLEVNSFPMFVRFDDAGQNCIVNSILDFLQTTKVGMLTQACCLLYTSPSPRDKRQSRMPSSA